MASVIRLAIRARDETRAAFRSAQRHARVAARHINRTLRDGIRQGLTGGTRDGDDIFSRWARRSAMRASAILRGVLSDGIAQGVAAGGPYVMAAAAVIAAGVAAILAAALAGALILALGGAFVAVAAVFAVKSKVIQRNWKQATKNMAADMKPVGEALVPVIHKAIHMLEKAVDQFAPHFRQAMEAASPALDDFMTRFLNGFKILGSRAWDDIMEAFNVFLVAFGPEWEDFMGGLGDSLGALARTVRDHSTEIATALGMVLGLITTIIDIVNFFANVWVEGMRRAGSAIGYTLTALATLTDYALRAFGAILHGIGEMIDAIPGMDNPLKNAEKNLNTFRENAVAQMRKTGEAYKNAGHMLDVANRKRVLQVDIKSWQANIAAAKKRLASVPPSKKSVVKAEISQFMAKIRAAKVELAMLRDKVVNVTVRNLYDSSLNRHATGGVVSGRATGGITRAASGGVRRAMTLVGEQGPELLDIPGGSRVHSNNASRRLMGGGGGAGAPMNVILTLNGKILAQELVEPQRELVRNRGGGSVQQYYGQKGRS